MMSSMYRSKQVMLVPNLFLSNKEGSVGVCLDEAGLPDMRVKVLVLCTRGFLKSVKGLLQ